MHIYRKECIIGADAPGVAKLARSARQNDELARDADNRTNTPITVDEQWANTPMTIDGQTSG